MIPAPTNFSEFDAQCIPFLRTITAIPGTAVTDLAAISTISMDTPLTVMVLIGGALQLWMLDAGTTATGPGVQRPNDYDGTTNPVVWVQLS